MDIMKRKVETSGGDAKKSRLEVCPHAEKCYRRNPHHFRQFDHPHLIKLIENDSEEIPATFPQDKSIYLEQIKILKPLLKAKPKEPQASTSSSATAKLNTDKSLTTNVKVTSGTTLAKLENCKPYQLFFTTIPKSEDTLKHYNSITFTDLLCPSLGQLKCSLQINFMIDIDWLMRQYKAQEQHKKPLTILYGDDWPDMTTFIDKFLPNVKYHFVKMSDPFGTHHSKIGLYVYEDNSIRVVVSTANLYYEDWNNYNQGLWISPLCKRLPDSSDETDGESPTGFKVSLVNYLKHYKLSILNEFIGYVQKADFSDVKVFLVTSVPGYHDQKSTGSHLTRVADLLSRHCKLPAKTTPESEGPLSWGIMAQSSSLGSMGKSPAEWLRGSLLRSLAVHKDGSIVTNPKATLNVIFPTVQNVLAGYFGPDSGGCLPYSKKVHDKQLWFNNYLHQWKADGLNRSRAMPHIKSYCRVSPCLQKLAWFILTSANISKAAWGGNVSKAGKTYVRSYEAGVMFLPKFFDEEYFEMNNTVNNKNGHLFPLMYDLPLTPYQSDDSPWTQ